MNYVMHDLFPGKPCYIGEKKLFLDKCFMVAPLINWYTSPTHAHQIFEYVVYMPTSVRIFVSGTKLMTTYEVAVKGSCFVFFGIYVLKHWFCMPISHVGCVSYICSVIAIFVQ